MSDYHEEVCPYALRKNVDDAVVVDVAARDSATKLLEYCQERHITYPLMIARFLVKVAQEELQRPNPPVAEPTKMEKETYTTWDHLDRLRYLEVPKNDELAAEIALLKGAVGNAFEGMREFINEERYAILKGRMLYNCLAVHTANEIPADVEQSKQVLRNAESTRPVGAALYTVASYIAHSCNPSARVTFPNGTCELALVANRDIPEGEEIRISFVPDAISRTTDDRQAALSGTWRFLCCCDLCMGRS